MAYQVLARKWRPQDFASVVGQQPVVQALRNALADGRIAQAYLFSGIRGVGKTSVARVFAKALNCPNDPPSDPCNECATCAEITKGSDLDVLEIDAATYSKVEQVRELTDSLRYGPARDPHKVVIIDEIHRLSRQAFDALLKIVEEPPEHLVFIFATTESEAVPATVLSRCQTFQFRRVPLAQMTEHLVRVSEAEELEVSEHALRLIARASEGSVRDAIALLDQLATFGGGKIADEQVGRIVGGVELSLFSTLLGSILEGESDQVSAFARKIEHKGFDPRHVYGQFLSYCRDGLHLAIDPDGSKVELPPDEVAELTERAAEAGYENLLRLLNLLLESEMTVRRSEAAGLALEITLLRAAELPKLTAIEGLLGRPEALPPLGGAGSGPEDEAEPPRKSSAGGSSRSARSGRDATISSTPGDTETSDSETGDSETSDSETGDSETGDSETGEPSRGPAASPPSAAAPSETETTAKSETTAQPEPTAKLEATIETEGAARGSTATDAEADPEVDADQPSNGDAETDSKVETEAASAPAESRHTADPVEPQTTDPPPGDRVLQPEGAAVESPKAPPEEHPDDEEPVPEPHIEEGRRAVGQLLERLSYVKQPLAAHLSGARSLAMRDGELVITTSGEDTVLAKTLARPTNKRILDRALTEMAGPEARWRVVSGPTGGVAAEGSKRSGEADDEEGTPDAVSSDPTVQKVLDLFGGRIESVEQRSES